MLEYVFLIKVECLEAEADVMKEVLVETESEKEAIETRNKDLKSHMELLLDDQVLGMSAELYVIYCFLYMQFRGH